ncbi:MAG: VCBS repeat-containing protein [Muribaculaceae bacterium]|nr:VCBS repeat-containing protein [Muribaculaceae bacterium]
MKRRYIFAIVSMLAGSSVVLEAQTAGSPDLVKFTKVAAPVPNQRVQGSNPAGEFYHAIYTGSAWGDYNEDGYLDLYYSHMNPTIDGNVVYSNLYQNDGVGTFSRIAFSHISPTAFSSPVWLDVNADGHLDLFASGIGQASYHWNDAQTQTSAIRSYLYLGNGDGTFEQVADHGIAPLFNGLTGGKAHNWASAGDYDHDGYIDLALAGFDDVTRMDTEHPEEAVRVVRLYRNVEGQRFELVENPLGSGQFHGLTDGSVVLCDLDGDGWLDLFTTGYGATRNAEAYIYWNNGNGTFTEGEPLPVRPTTDASSAVADLNNDGLPDLVLTGVYSDTGQKLFFVCRNDGNRQFSQVSVDNLEGVDGGQLAFGDVNHDGLADILVGGHGVTHEHTTWLYLNQGNFTFAVVGAYYNDPFGKIGSFSRVTHGSHHLVDVDRDGLLDAWYTGWSAGGCSKGCATELWHNASAEKGVTPNVAPSAPIGLRAQIAGDDLVFHWQSGNDEATPVDALRYNLFVREKGSTDTVFMLIPADLTTGTLRVSALNGALNTCTYRMKLPTGKSYEWGVQTIDNGNLASPFAVSELINPQSGVDAPVADEVKVTGAVGGLHYAVAGATTLTVYMPSGSIVARASVEGVGFLPVDATGVLVVKAESAQVNRSFKVVL